LLTSDDTIPKTEMNESVLCVVQTCKHDASTSYRRSFATLNHDSKFDAFVFANHQPILIDAKNVTVSVELSTNENGPWTTVDNGLKAGSVLSVFTDIKYARICCINVEESTSTSSTTVKASAFDVLMDAASEKNVPPVKTRFVSILCTIIES